MYQLYSIVSFFLQSHAGKRMVGEWYLQVLTSWHVTHVGMQLSMLNGEPVGIFQCLPFCFTIKRCFWGWCFRCFPRKSLFWALVLLVLIVYVFALIFTQSAAWKHQNWLNMVDGVGMSHPYLMYKGKGGYSWKYQYFFFGVVGWGHTSKGFTLCPHQVGWLPNQNAALKVWDLRNLNRTRCKESKFAKQF